MSIKIGKLILGGIGTYLLLSKGMKVLDHLITGTQEAVKWKAYYKSGNEDMVPPGYRQTTQKGDVTTDFTPGDENGGTSQDAQNEALKASVKKAIDNAFGRVEAVKRPLEGQTEAFKEVLMGSAEKCENCGVCTCEKETKPDDIYCGIEWDKSLEKDKKKEENADEHVD